MTESTLSDECLHCGLSLSSSHEGACPACGNEGKKILASASEQVTASASLRWTTRREYYETNPEALAMAALPSAPARPSHGGTPADAAHGVLPSWIPPLYLTVGVSTNAGATPLRSRDVHLHRDARRLHRALHPAPGLAVCDSLEAGLLPKATPCTKLLLMEGPESSR